MRSIIITRIIHQNHLTRGAGLVDGRPDRAADCARAVVAWDDNTHITFVWHELHSTQSYAVQKLANRLPAAIILLLLALTPIFNIGETGGRLLPGAFEQPRNFFAFQTPIWIKAIKDIGFWALMALGVARFLVAPKPPWQKWVGPALLLFAVMAALIATILDPSGVAPTQLYAGLRWALPLFLAFGLMGLLDAKDLHRIAALTSALLLLNLSAQLFQFANHLSVPAAGASSLFPRVGGFFYIPSTTGFFACVAAFWANAYLDGSRGKWLALAANIAAPVSIILAASAGAIATWLVMMFFLAFKNRWLKQRLLLLPIFAALIFFNINALSARTDILSYSAPKRLEIFVKAAQSIGPVSTHFGMGTNAGVILNRKLGSIDESVITDSFYTSAIINLGWVGGLVVLGLMAALAWLCLRTGQSAPIAFIALYALMALGTVFTEAFPMNMLFAAWLGAEIKSIKPNNQ